MTSHRKIKPTHLTDRPIMVVVFYVILINNCCINGDPAPNWSSRSLAGFRNLLRNGIGKMSPRQPIQSNRKHQSNSSFARKPANILSDYRKDNNHVHNRLKNHPSASTQLSKRRLFSWTSPPKTRYPSPRSINGHQYTSYSR